MQIVVLFSLCAVPGADAEVRLWTAETGETAKAAFDGLDVEKVELKLESGKKVAVPFDGLSEADQMYVYSVAEPAVCQLPEAVSKELDKGLADHAKLGFYKDNEVYKLKRQRDLLTFSSTAGLKYYNIHVIAKGRDWKLTHNWSSNVTFDNRTDRIDVLRPLRGVTMRVDEPFAVRGVPLPKQTMLFRDYEAWQAVSPKQLVEHLKFELKANELRDVQTQIRRKRAIMSFALLGKAGVPYIKEIEPLARKQEKELADYADYIFDWMKKRK